MSKCQSSDDARRQRLEYELTDSEYQELLEASRLVPLLYLSGGIPMGLTTQDHANAAWRALGQKRGFDYLTVQPSRSLKHFTAEPR